ncbi:uroporphyrinogen decarboxylase family protein [candidate division KSB1 bacterium]
MNSKERIQSSLNHREPDHLPLDLCSTKVTGIARVTYEKLAPRLGLTADDLGFTDIKQQLAQVSEEFLDRMMVDTRGLYAGSPSGWRMELEESEEGFSYTDEWGIVRFKPKVDGYYYDMTAHPLSGPLTVAEVEKYPWPNPEDPSRIEGLLEAAEGVQADGKALLIGGAASGILEMSLWLRGFEDFFSDLILDRKLAQAILDHVTAIKIAYWSKVLPLLGDTVSVVVEVDDLATQNGLMISPDIYRKMIKPCHTKVHQAIKEASKGRVKIFFHSCGAVRELLPDLIESGIDILNPLQVSAAGMEPSEIKRDFGDVLSFWGGAVNSQSTLPRGTPDEVRDETKRNIETLAPGGGFVFAPIHNVQRDVPVENFMAMWETWREYAGL